MKSHKDYIKFVLDLAGYLKWSIENDVAPMNIVPTIVHDVFGFLKGDEFFTPRTDGYAKEYFKEVQS